MHELPICANLGNRRDVELVETIFTHNEHLFIAIRYINKVSRPLFADLAEIIFMTLRGSIIFYLENKISIPNTTAVLHKKNVQSCGM